MLGSGRANGPRAQARGPYVEPSTMLNRLRDLKVATKLAAGFGALCLLLAIVVGMGVTRLAGSQNVLRTMSSSGVASVQAVGDARAAQYQIRLDFANLALTPDPAKFAEATEQ